MGLMEYAPLTSAGWPGRTCCGAKSGSPTNCCSSWAYGSHREPCASTCRNGLPGDPRRPALVDIPEESGLCHPRRRLLRRRLGDVRMLYVFVIIEHGTRRLAHVNVTARPSASWTLQQLREVIGDAESHKYLIHDRDAIFAKHLDDSIRALGVEVLRSPVGSPKAKAWTSYCTLCGRWSGDEPGGLAAVAAADAVQQLTTIARLRTSSGDCCHRGDASARLCDRGGGRLSDIHRVVRRSLSPVSMPRSRNRSKRLLQLIGAANDDDLLQRERLDRANCGTRVR